MDGISYEGDWVDDQKEGWGSYKWPDGKKYEGQWKANHYHGACKFSKPKGKNKYALFKKGKKVKWTKKRHWENVKLRAEELREKGEPTWVETQNMSDSKSKSRSDADGLSP